MNWKKFLRPTKAKITISIGLTFIWIIDLFILAVTKCSCVHGFPIGGYQCGAYHYESLTSLFFKVCYCYCPPPTIVLLLTRVIIPFIIIYLIVSLVALIIKKNKMS